MVTFNHIADFFLKHITAVINCNLPHFQPHLDGPLYFPAIATITLGSHTVLDFYDISSREDSRNSSFSLFLEPCSLLVQQGKIYHDYMHGNFF